MGNHSKPFIFFRSRRASLFSRFSCCDASNYSAPYYMISCLAVVLQQGMRCISNFRSS